MKKPITFLLLLVFLLLFFQFKDKFFPSVKAIFYCNDAGFYYYCDYFPPPPRPTTGKAPDPPNPTSAVSTINRKCYDSSGNLKSDDCIPCGSVPGPGCVIPEGAKCGECGVSSWTGVCVIMFWELHNGTGLNPVLHSTLPRRRDNA